MSMTTMNMINSATIHIDSIVVCIAITSISISTMKKSTRSCYIFYSSRIVIGISYVGHSGCDFASINRSLWNIQSISRGITIIRSTTDHIAIIVSGVSSINVIIIFAMFIFFVICFNGIIVNIHFIVRSTLSKNRRTLMNPVSTNR